MPRLPVSSPAPTAVFDLDGTLVDSVPDLAFCLNAVLEGRGLAPYARGEVAAMVGDGAPVLIARAFAGRGAVPDAAAVAEYLERYAGRLAVDTVAYEGVAEALELLGRAGWVLAVCTNKPEAHARGVLAALGLARHFAAVGGGDSFPTRKPDPAHLAATIAAAGGEVVRAVMVGDHANDLLAASGLGMPAIFARWGYSGPEVGEAAASSAAAARDVPLIAARLLGASL